jgi:hypothetical protein
MLELNNVEVFLLRSASSLLRRAATEAILQKFFVLTLCGDDFNILFSKFLPEPNDALRLVLG